MLWRATNRFFDNSICQACFLKNTPSPLDGISMQFLPMWATQGFYLLLFLFYYPGLPLILAQVRCKDSQGTLCTVFSAVPACRTGPLNLPAFLVRCLGHGSFRHSWLQVKISRLSLFFLFFPFCEKTLEWVKATSTQVSGILRDKSCLLPSPL